MFHISSGEDSKQPFLSFCKVEIDKVVSNSSSAEIPPAHQSATHRDMIRDQARAKRREPTLNY